MKAISLIQSLHTLHFSEDVLFLCSYTDIFPKSSLCFNTTLTALHMILSPMSTRDNAGQR